MDESFKAWLDEMAKEGWKIDLDKDGNVLFMSYWHPEIIVSKIDLKDIKK